MPLVIHVETTITRRDRCHGCGGLARVKDRDLVTLTDLPALVSVQLGVHPDLETLADLPVGLETLHIDGPAPLIELPSAPAPLADNPR